jgi:hypothetical protein
VDKYGPALGIGVSALILLGVLAWSRLEITHPPRALPPSPEAQANPYLALDRWLAGAGRPVRAEPQGSPGMIRDAPERTAFVQGSLFFWSLDAWKVMEPWVEAGGSLIISLDSDWHSWDEDGLEDFLKALGIALGEENTGYGFPGPGEPSFDHERAFSLVKTTEKGDEISPAPGDFITMTDRRGIIRLARLKHGAGSVTVTGEAYFLMNSGLDREPNARLAWYLLGGGEDGGTLFIRGRKISRSLFGRLAGRGNAAPLLLSALVLIALGFWMTVPRFGVPVRDDEKPGRPIAERFLAEGRFLAHHGALETYRAAFVREIRRRLKGREGLEDEAALDRRFGELWAEAARSGIPHAQAIGAESAVFAEQKCAQKMNGKGFTKTVDMLETILERL